MAVWRQETKDPIGSRGNSFVLTGISRVKLMLGFSIPVEDEEEDQDNKGYKY